MLCAPKHCYRRFVNIHSPLYSTWQTRGHRVDTTLHRLDSIVERSRCVASPRETYVSRLCRGLHIESRMQRRLEAVVGPAPASRTTDAQAITTLNFGCCTHLDARFSDSGRRVGGDPLGTSTACNHEAFSVIGGVAHGATSIGSDGVAQLHIASPSGERGATLSVNLHAHMFVLRSVVRSLLPSLLHHTPRLSYRFPRTSRYFPGIDAVTTCTPGCGTYWLAGSVPHSTTLPYRSAVGAWRCEYGPRALDASCFKDPDPYIESFVTDTLTQIAWGKYNKSGSRSAQARRRSFCNGSLVSGVFYGQD